MSPSPPGDTLRDLLSERDMSQSYLAWATGRSGKHINLLISGKATLSVAMALDLERELGVSAEFWMRRESDYWVALARLRRAREFTDAMHGGR